MSEPDRNAVALTSVPDQELSFARKHLPGARIEERKLSAALAREHRDVDVLSPMIHDPVEVDTLALFEDLEAIVTRSDGFDHLPRAWMRTNGVAGYHLGDYATTSVAHHTLGFILALLRRMPEATAMTSRREPVWDRSALMNRHLQDVTVGILGTGRIGSAVVRILEGLGAKVRGFDIDPDPELETIGAFAYTQELEGLLEVSDVLSIHVPLDEGTEGMIGADEIGLMPEHALLVNTARGAIVDQQAVARALQDGYLAGYAADVLPGEPDPPDLTRFCSIDTAILTPHLAAYDERTVNARYAYTARIVDAVLEGTPETVAHLRIV